jgi:hypothetical protein
MRLRSGVLFLAYIYLSTYCGILLPLAAETAFLVQIRSRLLVLQGKHLLFYGLRDVLNDLAGGNLVGCRSWESYMHGHCSPSYFDHELCFLGEELGGEIFLFIGLGGLSFFSLKRTLWFLVFHIYPLTFVTSMVRFSIFQPLLHLFQIFLETSPISCLPITKFLWQWRDVGAG